MNGLSILFPQGKNKALTLSYDDGVRQDIRLIEILNRHGIKATFNINAENAIEPKKRISNKVEISNIPLGEMADIYKGHEIATHAYSHPWLTKLHDSEIYAQIFEDRMALESTTGSPVRGHAYPFGEYDARVIRQLENCAIEYARTVVSTRRFEFPSNFMQWHPTCHHKDDMLFDLWDRFVDVNPSNSVLFYLWGHSYEFDVDGNWERIEQFCEKAGGIDDVWYATNIEIYDYIKAFYSLKFSADRKTVFNPSIIDIYLRRKDDVICAKSAKITKI